MILVSAEDNQKGTDATLLIQTSEKQRTLLKDSVRPNVDLNHMFPSRLMQRTFSKKS